MVIGEGNKWCEAGARAENNRGLSPISVRFPCDFRAPDRALVLVTHQVNITSLSGEFPAAGEIIVMRIAADGLETVGRIRSAD